MLEVIARCAWEWRPYTTHYLLHEDWGNIQHFEKSH